MHCVAVASCQIAWADRAICSLFGDITKSRSTPAIGQAHVGELRRQTMLDQAVLRSVISVHAVSQQAMIGVT